MPYGTKAQLLRSGNRPRLRHIRKLFAHAFGEIEPHSHVRWAAIRPHLRHARSHFATNDVLEVGSGSGEMTMEIADELRPLHLRSFDIQTPRQPSRVVAACFVADATHLPVASNSHDVVTMFDIIEHIPDDAAALREGFRALRPGGLLLISVPTPEYPRWFGRRFHEALGHVRDGYTPELLEDRLRTAGFDEIVIERHTGLPFLLFAVPYYRFIFRNVYLSAIATAASRPLALVDRHLPGNTWGALAGRAVKPALATEGSRVRRSAT